MTSIYLIGSLRNENVPLIGDKLRAKGFEVFDEWYSAGPEADDHFKKYHQERKISYDAALRGYAARHIFTFDKTHLDRTDIAILVCPSGRSGHLELGYMVGKGKPTYVLMDTDSDRWDLMYQFTNGIFFDINKLIKDIPKSITISQDPCVGLLSSTFRPSTKQPDCYENREQQYLIQQKGMLKNMEKISHPARQATSRQPNEKGLI